MMRHGRAALARRLRCRSHGRQTRLNLPSGASLLSHHPPSSSLTFSIQYPRLHSAARAAAPSPKKSRALPLLLIGVVLGSAVYHLSTPSSKPTLLNGEIFVPYAITSREAFSPSSFIITASPRHASPSPPYLLPGTTTWRHPLWSVEFKQPEVQIARHYTPLPPLHADRPADGSLRFYVRAVSGGEMSTYLSRLGIGQDVWLRGPHVGFDVARRLGGRKHVVFLAGGTGVAPGMQVVKVVLEESSDTRVSLLWAVRKREELQAIDPASTTWRTLWTSSRAVEVDASLEAPSPIARQLKELKAKYGARLRIQVAIDEEQTQFREADLRQAIITASNNKGLLAPGSIDPGLGCRLHDPAMLEKASDFESPEETNCLCAPGNDATTPGKNLFMVSGPDGFLSHYAGSKDWFGGQQIQGPVGGLAARLQQKHPHLAHEWLVLKL